MGRIDDSVAAAVRKSAGALVSAASINSRSLADGAPFSEDADPLAYQALLEAIGHDADDLGQTPAHGGSQELLWEEESDQDDDDGASSSDGSVDGSNHDQMGDGGA